MISSRDFPCLFYLYFLSVTGTLLLCLSYLMHLSKKRLHVQEINSQLQLIFLYLSFSSTFLGFLSIRNLVLVFVFQEFISVESTWQVILKVGTILSCRLKPQRLMSKPLKDKFQFIGLLPFFDISWPVLVSKLISHLLSFVSPSFDWQISYELKLFWPVVFFHFIN